MSLKALQERQTQLIMQRSQGKDIVENAERELGGVIFAIQQLNEYVKEEKEIAEAKLSKDVLADVLKFPAGNKDPAVDEVITGASPEGGKPDIPADDDGLELEDVAADEISTAPLDTDGPDSVA